jgi:HEAT repeat protein
LFNDLTQSAPRLKRRVAGLIRSLKHKATRQAVRNAITASMKGHGVHTRLAAAYALTGWNAEAGIKILINHLSNPSRRVRAEAGRYLLRKTLRPHAHVIAAAMAMERRPVVKGMLRRIVRLITPASFKPKLMHTLPL